MAVLYLNFYSVLLSIFVVNVSVDIDHRTPPIPTQCSQISFLASDRISIISISPLQLYEILFLKILVVCRCTYQHRMFTNYKKDSLDM